MADPVTVFGFKITSDVVAATIGGLLSVGGVIYSVRFGYKKAEKAQAIKVERMQNIILFTCEEFEPFSINISYAANSSAETVADKMYLAFGKNRASKATSPYGRYLTAAQEARQIAISVLSASKDSAELPVASAGDTAPVQS